MGYNDYLWTTANTWGGVTTAATTNVFGYQQAFTYPPPFTPTPVAAEPPKHDDMAWLREQVAEVREAAFA